MNVDVNDLWLGRMQQELGVLSSNLMLTTLQRDALSAKIAQDADLIEALKQRCQQAESANNDLRAQIQPNVKARQAARSKPRGRGDGAHEAQPT